MNVALVHDALVNHGGAEWVFQNFVEMFPKAKIYTTIYLGDKTYPFFKDKKIYTTKLQKFVNSEARLKALFPLANYYMQNLEIEDCDIILSSSTFSGKYVYNKKSKHICYCYTPFRLLWYFNTYKSSNEVKLNLIKPFLPILRKWDYSAAQRIDKFIAMTDETKRRIKEIYNKDSEIVHPPIDVSKYGLGDIKGNYFLVVSRLEPYKRVDLVINVFNNLNLPLKIVGKGTLEKDLKYLAKSNIEFLNNISEAELIKLYQGCIAVIFPQKEDYGLVPIEANACGKPVICYGYGGVETTMVPINEKDNNNATALFFYDQTEDALTNALNKFEKYDFNSEILLNNAKRFDKSKFKKEIYNIISRQL